MTDISKLTADESDRLSREAAYDAMFGPYDPHEAEMAALDEPDDLDVAPELDAEPEQHIRIRPSLFEVRGMALNLAKNTSWRVFPCRMPKKLPAISKGRGGNGYLDVTSDEPSIKALWNRAWGDLIGVATGAMSGIDVLDVDCKHETAVRWWAAASKRIGPSRAYRTNSGGHHVYFRHADGVKCSTSKLAHGVDVRGDGGYAIYWFADGCECLDHAPIAEWPEWLLQCVLWEPPPPPPLPAARPRPRFVHKDRRPSGQASADASITGIVRRVSSAVEGERNELLFWAACKLRDHERQGNITKAEASGLLIGAALAAGLDSDEAMRTVTSAWRTA
jgi:hypothetical protein